MKRENSKKARRAIWIAILVLIAILVIIYHTVIWDVLYTVFHVLKGN